MGKLWVLFIQFLGQLWIGLSFQNDISDQYPGYDPAGLEVYRFARQVMKDYGHRPTAISEFQVCWYHIDSHWQIGLVLQVGCLGHCHSSGVVSITDSFSTWTTQSMIGVPTIKGTHRLNWLPSRMTKVTCSSLYKGLLGKCTWMRTYPRGSI